MADYSDHHMPSGLEMFRHLIKTAQMNQKRQGITRAYVTLSSESIVDGNVGYDYFRQRYANLRQDLVNALMDAGRLRGVEVDEKMQRIQLLPFWPQWMVFNYSGFSIRTKLIYLKRLST